MMGRNAAIAAALALGLSTAASAQWATPPKPKPAQPWATPKAFSPKVGTLVLARYKGGVRAWPAMVTEVRGNLVTVEYSGSGKESLPASLITPLDWGRGTAVECKLGSPTYVLVTITALDRTSYAVQAVDESGKPRQTSLRFCRSLAG